MATTTASLARVRKVKLPSVLKHIYLAVRNLIQSLRSRTVNLCRRLSPKATPTLQTEPSTLPADVAIEEETMKGYNPKHLLPVRYGQSINERYTVISKLGYGGRSTVWLAHDTLRGQWQSNRYVALKICGNAYASTEDAEHETNVCRHVTATNPKHEGYPYVRTLLDSFAVIGPDGKHMCLVFEAMRQPTSEFLDEFGGTVPVAALKGMLIFWLRALDYLHTECHVIHTDIKEDNVI
ncbi:MAG: hypothetical protein Q9218_004746 [Villophora microphyllina]